MSNYKNILIAQVILAFWLVLSYDLLEDRRTIDVIITKFVLLCFRMAESFENLELNWLVSRIMMGLQEHRGQMPGYSWHPFEWQPPSGTVILHENTVEMNWYWIRGEGRGGKEQQES